MPTRAPGRAPSTPRLLALGRLGLAARLLARSLRNVLPLVGRVVLLGLPGAGVRGRAAVVLAGLGDAVALFLVLPLRGGLLGEAQGDHPGDGGMQQLRFRVHGSPLAAASDLTIRP